MNARRLINLVGAATAPLLWSSGPVWADLPTAPTYQATNVPLTTSSSQTLFELMGRPIADFRVAAGGFTPAERCALVLQRFQSIVYTRFHDDDVQTVEINGELSICLQGQLLLTVCEADAQANDTRREDLAAEWAGNLRSAVRLMTHEYPMGSPQLAAAKPTSP